MTHADSGHLQALVKEVVAKSKLSGKVNDVIVEEAELGEEGEFLRIVVHVSSSADISDADFDELASSLEDEIMEHDDRLPSVRFADA